MDKTQFLVAGVLLCAFAAVQLRNANVSSYENTRAIRRNAAYGTFVAGGFCLVVAADFLTMLFQLIVLLVAIAVLLFIAVWLHESEPRPMKHGFLRATAPLLPAVAAVYVIYQQLQQLPH
jgi:hypothetical protein